MRPDENRRAQTRATTGRWQGAYRLQTRFGGVVLVSAAVGCQASLELDEYEFAPARTVAPFGNAPSGGAAGDGAVGNRGMGGSGSVGASPPAAGSESGMGGTATLQGAGGGTPGTAGTGGTGGSGNVTVFAKICPDDTLLIDDMERDPPAICPHYGRSESYWFINAGSASAATTIQASPKPVVYEGIEAGRLSSTRALHVVMATLDEDDFGGFGFNFAFLPDKIAAFDASRYGGLSLYARGSGSFLVRLPTADSMPVSTGGRCVETPDEPCYNDHAVLLELTDEWQLHEYSFADFMPANYGPLRTFDPVELFGLTISTLPGLTNGDIWVDDIRFLPGSAP